MRKFLGSLPHSLGNAPESSRPNFKALSLVPNGPRQMTTVAFEDEPESFEKVAFRSPVLLDYESERMVSIGSEFTVISLE